MVLRFFIVIDADKDDFPGVVLPGIGVAFFLDLAASRLSVMSPFEFYSTGLSQK